MGPDDCKNAVMAAWRAFASGDRARVEACLAPDAEWLAPPGNATAVALRCTHHMIGRESIVRFIVEEFPRLFVRDVRVTFGDVLCEGNKVVVQERMEAGLANGRQYVNDYCFIFELDASGQIRRVREYMDTHAGHRMVFGAG
ncbi:MAG TPA: nuclear transport factor 2 family protein [Ramlibacter sp.]|nr:nuclear transport factor 2 family protein [Ramlibacter sp.]